MEKELEKTCNCSDSCDCGCNEEKECTCESNCTCEDCKCTEENNCGCMNGTDCTCDDECNCGDEYSCDDDCDCHVECHCGGVCDRDIDRCCCNHDSDCDDNCDCNCDDDCECEDCGCNEDHKKKKDKKEKKDKNEKYKKEIQELEIKVKELETKALASQAEMINYRRRKDEEISRMLKYANEDMVTELLQTIDNFERAIKMDDNNLEDEVSKFLQGFKMIYCNLVNTLEKFEVKAIDGANKEFDPTYHQAVMTEKREGMASGMVIEVLQKGYLLKDKVIRPAMVKVSE